MKVWVLDVEVFGEVEETLGVGSGWRGPVTNSMPRKICLGAKENPSRFCFSQGLIDRSFIDKMSEWPPPRDHGEQSFCEHL